VWRELPVLVRDAVGAGFLLAVFVVDAFVGDHPRPDVAVVVVAGIVAVAWRRRSPLVALVVSGGALCGATALAGAETGGLTAAVVVVYSAIAWGRRLAGTVAAVAELVGVAAVDVARTGTWQGTEVVALALVVAVAVAAGFAMQSRRETIASARERVARAERTREVEAARRVAEERLRIARELHDVLGHHVAVIGVQSGVAETLMASRPDAAREALRHVQDASEQVLTELAALVEVLREPGDDARGAPQPGLGALGALLDETRATGLVVDHETTGDVRPLAPVVDLVAYRVVQEALTNAHKHGDGSARLGLAYGEDTLTIEVVNRVLPDPVTQAEDGVGGHGLVGMRERVASVGGDLAAGLEGPTFRVSAVLPALAVREPAEPADTLREQP
jgi:signal transduction histidine kinase